MRAAALSLVLAAVPAVAAPPADASVLAAPSPVTAPAPVMSGAQPAAPALVGAEPEAPRLAPAAVAAPAPPSAHGSSGMPAPSAAPMQAVIDKLGQGDRSFLAGDYRAALFAYQDAVYMAPQSAAARVKLGRAYLALRYPAQALAQAEQALAAEPDNEDARRLAEEAKNPPSRPASTVTATTPPAASAPRPIPAKPARAAPSRVYRLTPEPDAVAPSEPAGAAGPATDGPAPGDAVARAPQASPAPAVTVVVVEPGTRSTRQEGADPGSQGAPTPGQRYRAALDLLGKREFAEAIRELSAAIAADPRMAVAYSARGSAQFGLGRYRPAAEDYRAAIALDANLATPLYGLAECYRAAGNSAWAADMYKRYAESRASDVREDLRAIAAKRAQGQR